MLFWLSILSLLFLLVFCSTGCCVLFHLRDNPSASYQQNLFIQYSLFHYDALVSCLLHLQYSQRSASPIHLRYGAAHRLKGRLGRKVCLAMGPLLGRKSLRLGRHDLGFWSSSLCLVVQFVSIFCTQALGPRCPEMI